MLNAPSFTNWVNAMGSVGSIGAENSWLPLTVYPVGKGESEVSVPDGRMGSSLSLRQLMARKGSDRAANIARVVVTGPCDFIGVSSDWPACCDVCRQPQSAPNAACLLSEPLPQTR